MLGIATAPLVFAFAKTVRIEVDRLEVVAIGTVFWGWAMSLADMPIYMLYEGRRFWPARLRAWALERETRRLAKIKQNLTDDVAKSNRPRYLESAVDSLNFPLNGRGELEVRFPTRIGNLIAAYETYTQSKYGLDAIFYWPRLWVVLDKDLREEIDNQQAIADSSIYTSFALWLAGAMLFLYAIANGLLRARLANVPQPLASIGYGVGCGCAAFAVYRVSLFAHAQFGEVFKGVFDQHRGKIVIDKVVEQVARLAQDADVAGRPEADRYAMVVRYLRWHRIRPPSESRNFTPEEWKEELERRHEAAKDRRDRLPIFAAPKS